MSQPDTRAGRWWLVALGMSLSAAGMVFTWVLWTAWRRAEETRAWPSAPCVILSSTVTVGRPTPNSNPAYETRVRYKFEFGGQTRAGTGIRRVDGPTVHESRARALAARFPPGLETLCHVNPVNPEQTVLLHGSRAPLYSIWFPLLFVAGGAVMSARALR
jgi:hypothetical protein